MARTKAAADAPQSGGSAGDLGGTDTAPTQSASAAREGRRTEDGQIGAAAGRGSPVRSDGEDDRRLRVDGTSWGESEAETVPRNGQEAHGSSPEAGPDYVLDGALRDGGGCASNSVYPGQGEMVGSGGRDMMMPTETLQSARDAGRRGSFDSHGYWTPAATQHWATATGQHPYVEGLEQRLKQRRGAREAAAREARSQGHEHRDYEPGGFYHGWSPRATQHWAKAAGQLPYAEGLEQRRGAREAAAREASAEDWEAAARNARSHTVDWFIKEEENQLAMETRHRVAVEEEENQLPMEGRQTAMPMHAQADAAARWEKSTRKRGAQEASAQEAAVQAAATQEAAATANAASAYMWEAAREELAVTAETARRDAAEAAAAIARAQTSGLAAAALRTRLEEKQTRMSQYCMEGVSVIASRLRSQQEKQEAAAQEEAVQEAAVWEAAVQEEAVQDAAMWEAAREELAVTAETARRDAAEAAAAIARAETSVQAAAAVRTRLDEQHIHRMKHCMDDVEAIASRLRPQQEDAATPWIHKRWMRIPKQGTHAAAVQEEGIQQAAVWEAALTASAADAAEWEAAREELASTAETARRDAAKAAAATARAETSGQAAAAVRTRLEEQHIRRRHDRMKNVAVIASRLRSQQDGTSPSQAGDGDKKSRLVPGSSFIREEATSPADRPIVDEEEVEDRGTDDNEEGNEDGAASDITSYYVNVRRITTTESDEDDSPAGRAPTEGA